MDNQNRLAVRWQQRRKVLLTVVLAIYCFCLVIVYSPPSPFTRSIQQKVKPVMGVAGLFYAFRPFSPDPQAYNEIITAVVVRADGSKNSISFPNGMTRLLSPKEPHVMEGSPWSIARLGQRMRMIWQQHFWDCITYRLGKDKVLCPNVCRYIARLDRQPGNLPLSVSLYRERRPIVLPSALSGQGMAEISGKEPFFSYQVQRGDLE